MKKELAITIVIVLALSAGALAASEVKWHKLKDGREKAKIEKKPMLVDFFYDERCPRCAFLQKEVYDNPSIAAKIMADFIPVRVDLTGKLTDDEEQLGKQYDYKNDCLLLFLDHNGNIMKYSNGMRLCFIDKVEPEMFVKYLDTVKANLNNK
ncbi:MAG: thioredoxin family protein [Nitrospirae bacterium]|nr:thioredoxin family protein [Nitrospirota bacterium]MCL5236474.1 thioredoxin family protein [Nitrospirota bacterium]